MFKREHRYLVFKIKDIEQYLDTGEQEFLFAIGAILDACRKINDKPPLECVVVENDWPEYETVWKMIEARCHTP